ncbi:MAG: TIGR04283 family arsenosugar biosynthesis glycosyltransferase [Gracilimonas sp.]|uniref:TIGR04283 family arsenosugar biosynthesis glycosyltransferase n=1 Tax=Gracilimonas sp. TaxID=1974203 RepID=UPI0019A3EB70|nr:TIGR04283 family arsenosugar biosynthesis glycosyltransferase [Gracilimonas sp.]MBD3616940.1 TIGR04283 family arsenosugar biosynthesis glycosyltransferase [Gracilimonas sp.]
MISIIIPAYNEEKKIGDLIAYLYKHCRKEEAEIIVVDGGSTDNTVELAQKKGAVTVTSPQKGRARQMNYGAKNAKGEWLYFLHADTTPPPTFITDIRNAVDSGYDCGCFRLRFDSNQPVLKFYSWFTRFDIDFFRFGDQSLFVKKTLFEQINGFDEALMVMEDQEIVSRLKAHAQFSIISKPVFTSARKYENIGVFRLQLIFVLVVFLYYLRVNQYVIMHFYKENLK